MPTALLICMENTFWHSGDHNFVELFKRSFKLYVESGTRKKLEAAINLLRNDSEQVEHLVTDSEPVDFDSFFEAKFYMLITEHLLRKFHSFFAVVLDTS
jgi:hypothetical protein